MYKKILLLFCYKANTKIANDGTKEQSSKFISKTFNLRC